MKTEQIINTIKQIKQELKKKQPNWEKIEQDWEKTNICDSEPRKQTSSHL